MVPESVVPWMGQQSPRSAEDDDDDDDGHHGQVVNNQGKNILTAIFKKTEL